VEVKQPFVSGSNMTREIATVSLAILKKLATYGVTLISATPEAAV
jgi:hypothetical protein